MPSSQVKTYAFCIVLFALCVAMVFGVLSYAVQIGQDHALLAQSEPALVLARTGQGKGKGKGQAKRKTPVLGNPAPGHGKGQTQVLDPAVVSKEVLVKQTGLEKVPAKGLLAAIASRLALACGMAGTGHLERARLTALRYQVTGDTPKGQDGYLVTLAGLAVHLYGQDQSSQAIQDCGTLSINQLCVTRRFGVLSSKNKGRTVDNDVWVQNNAFCRTQNLSTSQMGILLDPQRAVTRLLKSLDLAELARKGARLPMAPCLVLRGKISSYCQDKDMALAGQDNLETTYQDRNGWLPMIKDWSLEVRKLSNVDQDQGKDQGKGKGQDQDQGKTSLVQGLKGLVARVFSF